MLRVPARSPLALFTQMRGPPNRADSRSRGITGSADCREGKSKTCPLFYATIVTPLEDGQSPVQFTRRFPKPASGVFSKNYTAHVPTLLRYVRDRRFLRPACSIGELVAKILISVQVEGITIVIVDYCRG